MMRGEDSPGDGIVSCLSALIYTRSHCLILRTNLLQRVQPIVYSSLRISSLQLIEIMSVMSNMPRVDDPALTGRRKDTEQGENESEGANLP